MANIDKIDSIIDKAALAEVSALEASLKSLNATMITSLDATIKLSSEFKNATGIKEIVELNNKYNQTSQELIKYDKERAQLQQKLAEANDKLKASEEALQNARKKHDTVKLTAEERELNAQRNIAEKQAAKQAIAEKQLDDIIKKSATTKGEAARQNVILTQASKGVNVTTEDGIKKLKEINAAIDKNNAIIQANSDQLTKQKMNVGNYTQSIKDAALQLKNSVTPAGLAASGISGVGSSLKGLATASAGFIGVGLVAAVGAVRGAFSSLKEEIDKAMAKETSIARFNNTLRNMGHTDWAKDLNTTIKDLKGQFQSLSGIDLTSSTQKLATYGKLTKEQVQSLLPVIVNFAAQSRIGMDEATVTIIKALEGQGRALKTYGINLKSGGSDIENYNQVLNVLGQKVAGSAKVFEESSEGAIARHNRKLGELKTTIGTQVLPAYTSMIEMTTKFASALVAIPIKAVASVLAGLISLFALYQLSVFRTNLLLQIQTEKTLLNIIVTKTKAAATVIATVATSAYSLAVAVATGNISLATAATVAWNAALNLNPVFRIAAGVIAAGAAIYGLVKAFSGATDETVKNTTATVRNMEAAKKAKEQLQELNKINAEATGIYSHQYAKVEQLAKIVSDKTKSHKEQLSALKELIELDPKYLGGLTQENILTKEGTRLINEYKTALKSKAEAQAYANRLSAEYEAKIPKEIQMQQELLRLSELRNKQFRLQVEQSTPSLAKGAQASLEVVNAQIRTSTHAIAQLSKDVKVHNENIELYSKKAPKATGATFNERGAKQDNGASDKAAESQAEKHAKRMQDIRQKTLENEAKLEDDAEKKALAELNAKYQKEKDFLQNSGSDKVKLSEKERKDVHNAIKKLDLAHEIEEKQIKVDFDRKRAETDYKNRIASVEKGSKEELLAKLGLISIQRAKEKEEAEKTGADVSQIQSKYRAEILNAQKEYNKKRISLIDEGYSQEEALRKEEQIGQLIALEGDLNKGKITQQQYEDKKLSIISNSAINETEILIKLSKEKAELLSGKDKMDALKKIAVLEQQLSNKTAQVEIDNAKKSKDAKLKALRSQLETAKEVTGRLAALGAALYERQIDKIDKEKTAYDEAAEAKIAKIEDQESRGVITAETAKNQKKAITDAQAKHDAEADKKKTELKKKQAILDKATAVTSAIINTALGITSALSAIITAPMAPFIAALGAIEVATIIATPLAYAKGTPKGGHAGGSAIVGDGGRSEMLITSKGVFKTKDTPTFIPDLEKGAVVLPDFDKASDFLMKASLNHNATASIYDDRAMLGRIDSLGGEMRDIKILLKMNLSKGGNDMDRLAYELYKNNTLR